MSLFINTNVASLNATRQLFTSNNSLSTAFERLSSGIRICKEFKCWQCSHKMLLTRFQIQSHCKTRNGIE